MTERPYPKTVIVDFDGTICKFAFPDVGPPEPNVREGLQKLRDAGYKIVIHSVRTATYWNNPKASGNHFWAITDFMEKHNLPYDEILLNIDKPIAMAYIDDRGVAYRGDWLQAANEAIELMGR